MQGFVKIGTLLILLVLPIFVYLFLQTFGKNRYKIPIFYPEDSIQVDGKWIVNKYQTIPDFNLIDQNNQPFKASEKLKGKVYVADFFFTRCGSVCPVLTSELARVQEAYKNTPDVVLVSHTVDTEHDTPEVLKKYAEKYKAIEGKWFFLTGDKKQIFKLAYNNYKVNAGEESATITPDFFHASKLILIDKEKRVRGYYDGTDAKSVDKLILEIKILLEEYR